MPYFRFASVLRDFRRDAFGTSAILLGICALPAIGMVGLGVDYYNGLSNKTRLDEAADAAAIAAITTAQSYINANAAFQVDPYLTNNAEAAGKAQALKVFPANAGPSFARASAVPSVSMNRTGQTITALVSYTGSTRASFGKLFGVPSLNLHGQSGSSLTMGSYLDFYLVPRHVGIDGAADQYGRPAAADGDQPRPTLLISRRVPVRLPFSGGARATRPLIRVRTQSPCGSIPSAARSRT